MGCSGSRPSVKKDDTKASKTKESTGGNGKNSPLTDSEIMMRIEAPKEVQHMLHAGITIKYAWVSQRGYYPEAPDKSNQDSYSVIPNFGGQKDQAFFGVFDGHGKAGHLCSWYIRDHLPNVLMSALEKDRSNKTSKAIKKAITKAHVETNEHLHRSPDVEDEMSGTTSITVLLRGRTLFVSNVGDSRAIILSVPEAVSSLNILKDSNQPRLVAKPLSSDQTPYRKDERDRVKRCGARVLSMGQLEGSEPIHENWGDLTLGEHIDEGGDPPRIWSRTGGYPGTAFTRSFGDHVAEELGVFAEPEILERELTMRDEFVVIASDGVFEFLTNQMVADMVAVHMDDPLAACKSIVSAAYNMWLQYEVRTDDITIIILHVGNRELSSIPVTTAPPELSRVSSGDNILAPSDIVLAENRPVRRAMSREKKKLIIVSAETKEEDEDVDFDINSLAVQKSPEDFTAIANAVKNNFLFQHLNASQRQTVINVMQPVQVSAGQWVITQGDEGDRFYVVDSGRYEVRVRPPTSKDPSGGDVVHVYESGKDLHPGFGELSLMYGKPRAASVIALTSGKLWALDRRVFRKVIMRSSDARKDVIRTLRSIELFKSMDLTQLQRMADLFSEQTFTAGTYIIRQGEKGENFYVILSGLCDCTKNNDTPGGDEVFLVQRKQHEYFGERALLSLEPRAANVIARTDTKVLYIGKSAFDHVLGPLAQIIDNDRIRREAVAEALQKAPKNLDGVTMTGLISRDDLGPLIMGTFGASAGASEAPGAGVTAVTDVTVRSFLLSDVNAKSLNGSVISFLDAARSITASSTHNQLLPRLFSTSKQSNAFHLVFPVPVVSDLSSLLKANNADGGLRCYLESVIYVAACVVSALETLHGIGIVYRSVQPEGLHVDSKGRIVLMEHRVCKVGGVGARSYTICGASDYLAPEQISQVGHGAPVDFWALGVLVFELFTGQHPFSVKGGEVATYSRITAFGTKAFPSLAYPDTSSISAAKVTSFVDKLVVSSPEARLGAGVGSSGFPALKKVAFFEGVNFAGLADTKSPMSPLARAAHEIVAQEGLDQEIVAAFDAPHEPADWELDVDI